MQILILLFEDAQSVLHIGCCGREYRLACHQEDSANPRSKTYRVPTIHRRVSSNLYAPADAPCPYSGRSFPSNSEYLQVVPLLTSSCLGVRQKLGTGCNFGLLATHFIWNKITALRIVCDCSESCLFGKNSPRRTQLSGRFSSRFPPCTAIRSSYCTFRLKTQFGFEVTSKGKFRKGVRVALINQRSEGSLLQS